MEKLPSPSPRVNAYTYILRFTSLACLAATLAGFCIFLGKFQSNHHAPTSQTVPFQLTSNSMAPSLLGPHYPCRCLQCGLGWEIAAETYRENLAIACPFCSSPNCRQGSLKVGQNVHVEPIANRKAARLDALVFTSDPGDANNDPWTCKRVWGLPGEKISLRHGELCVNDEVFQKSFDEFSRVAMPVAAGNDSQTRDVLQLLSVPRRKLVLGDPVFDEYPMNHSTPRNLVQVADLMLCLEFDDVPAHAHNVQGRWMVECQYRGSVATVICHFGGASPVPESPATLVATHPRQLKLGGWDGWMWARWDNEPAIRLLPNEPLDEDADRTNRTSFSIQWVEGNVPIHSVQLFRDLYLRDNERDPSNGLAEPVLLGAEDYYVIGDNLPCSRDSRNGLGTIDRPRILGVVEELSNR